MKREYPIAVIKTVWRKHAKKRQSDLDRAFRHWRGLTRDCCLRPFSREEILDARINARLDAVAQYEMEHEDLWKH